MTQASHRRFVPVRFSVPALLALFILAPTLSAAPDFKDTREARNDTARALSSPGVSPSAPANKREYTERIESLDLASTLDIGDPSPPVRCTGLGDLVSISLEDWESGLGSWTVSHVAAKPPDFDTPDWAVTGSLPDSRAGSAAFVPNLDTGDCDTEDHSGVLSLDSPSILIPMSAEVPRLSIAHWMESEFLFDGGNLKISVDGGPWTLIPTSAFEVGPYNQELASAAQTNTNPLESQPAFTGPGGGASGAWGESHVNLFGIAGPGDTVRLRLDFGIDLCGGVTGWYVDEVEFYECSLELPPSDCGNGLLDAGEECDDGNGLLGDGCSNSCEVESGWVCSAPVPPGDVADPGFELGTPNPSWEEYSKFYITPICDAATCGTGAGSGPLEGDYWVWFGGTTGYEEGYVAQDVVIPENLTTLTFGLEASACGQPEDYTEVLVDGVRVGLVDGTNPICGQLGYTTFSVDISPYADGGTHEIRFHSEVFYDLGQRSYFYLDEIALPGIPSICRLPSLTLVKNLPNDDGGTATQDQFQPYVDGSPVDWDAPVTLYPGTYVASEDSLTGYQAGDWGGDCAQDGSVTLVAGDDLSCTVTNDDIAPTLTLVKTVTNDDGGSATQADFQAYIDATPADWDTPISLDAGEHSVTEDEVFGYLAGDWGGDCAADGSITLAPGDAATCTITNDDIAPTLTLVKQVTNDNGGTLGIADFTLLVDGSPVASGVPVEVLAGAHAASETPVDGYAASGWSGDCDVAGSVSLAVGENKTCTITNDDVAPTLTVVKTIVNDNNGTEQDPNAFGLRIDGALVSDSVANVLDAGAHTVSEDGLPGYIPSAWGGDCAGDGSITLAPGDAKTCSITNDDTEVTSLTLVKQVVNDDGGTQAPSAWTLNAAGPTPLSGSGPTVSSEADFVEGLYTLSESGPGGYAASAWSCVGAGVQDGNTITLALGDAAICTIVNDDIAPSLTLVKQVTNDDGGTLGVGDFTLLVDGSPVASGVPLEVSAGAHVASETPVDGYTASDWGGDCDAAGNVILAPGENKTCTVTNDDIAPTLTLVKQVTNDDGGTLGVGDFTLLVDGSPVTSGVPVEILAGAHVASETPGDGYAASDWGGDCDAGGNVVLAPGENKTCTVTNDDIAPTLTLVKLVTNDDGGTLGARDFALFIDGNPASSGEPVEVLAGAHVASETAVDGYAPSGWGGDCDAGGNVVLAPGDSKTCTITNDDIAPTLTLVKLVTNDDGGTLGVGDFTLLIDGSPVTSGAPVEVLAGAHVASETPVDGYAPSDWGGDCDAAGHVSLAVGEDKTCTITNDDIAPTLTLVKLVTNDNGGTLGIADFTLMVDGSPVTSSVPVELMAGDHVASETPVDGYEPSDWTGDCDAAGNVTLQIGEDKTCTVTNDDIAPTLTLVKNVMNDDGGSLDAGDFSLFIDALPVVSGEANTLDAGSYLASETPVDGYAPSDWGGDCDAAGNVTLQIGDDKTCTITNDDISPTLTVQKIIVNDNNGVEDDPDAFGLRIDGGLVSHGVAYEVLAGAHTVSEDGLPGYVPGDWGGDCAADGSIVLDPGQAATCSITNDDTEVTSLTLVKQVVNDDGGNEQPSAWTLNAAGPTPLTGSGPTVNSGQDFAEGLYTLSESGPDGYAASSWSCVGDGTQEGNTISLAIGDAAICTIVNDDVAPTLTVTKIIVNDSGGTVEDPDAFVLRIDGVQVFHGDANVLDAGEHTVTEDGLPGYNPGGWGGDCNADGTIILTPGQSASCTITNDDEDLAEVIFHDGFEAQD